MGKINTELKNFILTPFNLLFRISPVMTTKLLFRLKCKTRLNLENPQTLNEKLQWLKLYYRNDLIPKCADKFSVREYVTECGCSEILNELLWYGFDANEIPFDSLPNQFVAKITNGSGFIVICKDKNLLDKQIIIRKLNRWLKIKMPLCYGEWFYGIERPRIIIESFLSEDGNSIPCDYKIFCFNGKVELFDIHTDRFTNHKRNVMDKNWETIHGASITYRNSDTIPTKPVNLNEMIRIAEILSKPFPHVRVDFYNIKGKIYFGELTFCNGAGFSRIGPYEFHMFLGSLLHLPQN